MDTVIVDASQKPLGRIASDVARLLLGKHIAEFRRHIVGGQKVVVINTDKIILSGRKLKQKMYYRHTGVIGHLRMLSAEQMMEKDSRAVFRKAVRGMLPKNRLLDGRMKLLTLYTKER